MSETLEITTEQINDLPLVLGIVEDRGIRQMIDARIRPHGGWQGISVGTVVSIWLCHLLMERDHRLVSVRDWAAARTHTVNALLGITRRETDLTDDRLANALTMLSDAADQAAVDRALLADWMQVYALPTKTVRLDSTSVSVYHDDPPPEGLLRRGHSKDHRPDLAQFKVMLASLDPLGLPVALQVVPGNQADDGLYVPAYDAAVRTLGTADVLVVGDSKMGARTTRAHSAATQSAYLCAYRPAGATAEIDGWIEEALAHPARWQELRTGDERTGEITTRAVIDAWERDQQDGDTAWTERVLVVRSTQMQAGLRRTRERTLARVAAQRALLQRPPGRGRTVYRTRAALDAVVTGLLTAAHLEDIVQVTLVASCRSRWSRGAAGRLRALDGRVHRRGPRGVAAHGRAPGLARLRHQHHGGPVYGPGAGRRLPPSGHPGAWLRAPQDVCPAGHEAFQADGRQGRKEKRTVAPRIVTGQLFRDRPRRKDRSAGMEALRAAGGSLSLRGCTAYAAYQPTPSGAFVLPPRPARWPDRRGSLHERG